MYPDIDERVSGGNTDVCAVYHFGKKRLTAAATAAAYGLMALLCGGTLVTFLVAERIPPQAVFGLLSLNPFVAAVQVSCDSLLDAPIYSGLWRWNVGVLCGLIVLFVLVSVIRFRRVYAPDR